jgi:peptide/nickel transport system substrate-binding protein
MVLVALIIVASMILAGCGEKSTTTTAKTSTSTTTTKTTTSTTTTTTSTSSIQKGGVLKLSIPFSAQTTPGWPSETTEFQKVWFEYVCYEPLVKLAADITPIPWLATSWEWGPNNSYITFNLRKGVQFHDGTNFTAEAVKLEGDICIEGKQSNTVTWDRWEVIDDNTVRLYLKEYLNNFWVTVRDINMCFFSPTAYKNNQPNGMEYIKYHPIGTGPFKFESFERDVAMKFVKNDNYWQPGKPYLDGLQFVTIKEAMTQQAALESGETNGIIFAGGSMSADLKAKGFIQNARFGGVAFLAFDTANANSIWNNVKLRMAVEYAIDKQTMCDALGYGTWGASNQMPPFDNPSFNPNLPTRGYDPAKAKALLTEAGYPDGLTIEWTCGQASAAELSMQQYLKDIGINYEMTVVDNNKYWDLSLNGWTGVMSSDLAVGANYAEWLRSYFPPTGIYHQSTKLPDAVVAKLTTALQETDNKKLYANIWEIGQLLYDDCTLIPIHWSAASFVLSSKLHDSVQNTTKYYDWQIWEPENAWLSK